ncbi:hypothetical protein [Phocaeicola sp.]
MEHFKASLFDCKSGGYIIISRQAMLYLLKSIKIDSPFNLYVHMLANANYNDKEYPNGNKSLRGELDITTDELGNELHVPHTSIYRMVKELEKNKVVVKKNDRFHPYFLLTMYEEHCGYRVRPEERAAAQAKVSLTEEDFETFFSFYYHIMEIPPKDKEKARREWSRLSMDDRDEALCNIITYHNASNGQKYMKHAYSYLREKSFKM